MCTINVRHLNHQKPSPTRCCCSVAQPCPTLRDPMDYSTTGLPVPHHLMELPTFISTESVMQSSHLILSYPLLRLPSIFPALGSFPMNWLFASGGQSIGASASVLHPLVHGKIVFHETSPWCQKVWVPLIYEIYNYKTCFSLLTFCISLSKPEF